MNPKHAIRWAALGVALVSNSLRAADWPHWRGPQQNGASLEKAVVASWNPSGENVLWKTPIEGRTTPILIKGRLYAVVPAGDVKNPVSIQERVICVDAESGKLIWEKRFNVFDSDIVQQRLGWTAMVGDPDTGYVYAHLTGGEFVCLDRDGKIVWKHSLTEEFGRISGYGGRLHTPILDEERVIISFMSSSWGDQGKPLHRYVAFEKKSGEILWWSGPGEQPYDTTYSTPAVAVISGKRMLIAANGDGSVYGMLARTGEKVWSFKLSKRGLNASVVVNGDHAYVCNGEENLDSTEMGRVVCIDASKAGDITTSGEVWRAEGIKAGFASPALANGRLYVLDNSANLFCIDANTGKIHWNYSLGRVGKGSPTVTADGVIYVGEQNGAFHILRDAGDHCESLDMEQFEGPNDTIDEIYGSPIVADGRVYFMTRYHMYALGVRGKTAETTPAPAMMAEAAPAGAAARLHLFPADVTLSPGKSRSWELRAFDNLARTVPPESDWRSRAAWTVTGVKGAVGPDGNFQAAADNVFSAGTVTAKLGELSAVARVRVTPQLPITENFDALPVDSAPPGWLGVGGGKVKIEERDGSRVLHKLASKEKPSPPFMRVRGYLTPPLAGGYTMQVDILGTPKGERFRPDMGLINTRYFMTLMSQQELWVESWSTIPRLHYEMPFTWETNKWYRMKMRVDVAEKETRIRGKVWLRDAAEPEAWIVDVVDPFPHREGSPGIYAYSAGTTPKSDGPEVFYDNIRVTPNE